MNSKKQLEIALSKLRQVRSPKATLEQYPTPSTIAAEVLWTAYMNGNTKDKVVADLGCGNGILGIGARLLGAKKVFFLDTDSEAILITKENTKDLTNIVLLHQEVTEFHERVDTIIQNPPFGVQTEHADKLFLLKAMEVSQKIYSIHKIESESFIRALAHDHNFTLISLMKFKLSLKKTQPFHMKESYAVQVGCFILHRNL